MREIRTSSSMRGGRKRAFARRACLLLYRVPIQKLLFFRIENILTNGGESSSAFFIERESRTWGSGADEGVRPTSGYTSRAKIS